MLYLNKLHILYWVVNLKKILKEKEMLKKGIYIVLSISLFLCSCLTLGKIDNDKAVNVNSTPITNKVIVVDAGHRKTR